MQVVLITDNYIKDVIAVYTLKRFIQEVNKEYWEANDFNGDREYFKLDKIDWAIDWYVETSDELSIDVVEVQSSLDDKVLEMNNGN